jgi:FMN phosphatase YigB (HAD superfamily)
MNHKETPVKDVKAVIFDLGRVMVDLDLTNELWRRIMIIQGDQSNPQPGKLLFGLYEEYATGKIDSFQFHNKLISLSDLEISYEDFVPQWCQIFRPIEGMVKLFSQVAERVPIGILSDIDPLHWDYLQKNHDFVNKVKSPTLSFEFGALKPHPKIYPAAAKNVGLPIEECFFTDDLEKNIQGAIKAGMDAVQFKGVEDLTEELKKRNII